MTFPRDKTQGAFEAEDHSTLSIVVVSFTMIMIFMIFITVLI